MINRNNSNRTHSSNSSSNNRNININININIVNQQSDSDAQNNNSTHSSSRSQSSTNAVVGGYADNSQNSTLNEHNFVVERDTMFLQHDVTLRQEPETIQTAEFLSDVPNTRNQSTALPIALLTALPVVTIIIPINNTFLVEPPLLPASPLPTEEYNMCLPNACTIS